MRATYEDVITPEDEKLGMADIVVSTFYSALKSGESNLEHVPGLLLRIINEEMWQDRIMRDGKRAKFDRFVDFVESKPLEGLGESLDLIKKLCRDNPVALSAIDKETVGKVGASIGNQNAKGKTNHSIRMDCIEGAKQGTTRQYALRKLRKSRPDLHQQVLYLEITAHQAMIEAGFRKKTYTVRHDVNSVIKLLDKFSKEERDEIIQKLIQVKEE